MNLIMNQALYLYMDQDFKIVGKVSNQVENY